MGTPGAFGPLLRTVLESIFEVFIMCFMGWVLARRGILDKPTRRKLNIINVSLFTPCLLFPKVAFSLNPQKLKELWIIPIIFVVVTCVSAMVAWIMGTMLRLKRSQRNFGVAASMFNNSNSLPIALMQSMVVTVHGLKWGSDDTKDAMLGRALGYLVLYSTFGLMLRWSYGVHLLAQADEDTKPHATGVGVQPEDSLTGAASSPKFSHQHFERSLLNSASHPAYSSTTSNERLLPLTQDLLNSPNQHFHRRFTMGPRTGPKFFYHSFPNTPVRSLSPTATPSLIDVTSEEHQQPENDEWGNDRPRLPYAGVTPPTPSGWRSCACGMRDTILKTLKRFHEFMTIPLYAALASFIVALIPSLQHFMMEHVTPVRGFLTSAGACSIPVTMIVLGAYFYNAPQDKLPESSTAIIDAEVDEDLSIVSEDDADPEQGREASLSRSAMNTSQLSIITLAESVKGALKMRSLRRRFNDRGKGKVESGERPGETTTVVIACLARMIVTPLIILPVMGVLALNNVHPLFEDPVFVVTNVLLVSSPPALTLAQITQAAAGDAFERLISRTIFWSYCVLTPPLTLLYVVVGLRFSR